MPCHLPLGKRVKYFQPLSVKLRFLMTFKREGKEGRVGNASDSFFVEKITERSWNVKWFVTAEVRLGACRNWSVPFPSVWSVSRRLGKCVQWSARGDRPWFWQRLSGNAPIKRSRRHSRNHHSCRCRGGLDSGNMVWWCNMVWELRVWHSPYAVEAVDVVPQSLSKSVSVHAFMHGHPVIGQVAHNLQSCIIINIKG